MTINTLEVTRLSKGIKGCTSCSKFKVMLTVFCDILGVAMAEWVSNGQPVNQYSYIEILTKLFE
jgi:hypothetical protein